MGEPAPATVEVNVEADNAVINTAEDGGGVDNVSASGDEAAGDQPES